MFRPTDPLCQFFRSAGEIRVPLLKGRSKFTLIEVGFRFAGCKFGAQSLLSKHFFFKLGFTPCKTEKPLRRTEVQESEAKKILKHTGNPFRKNIELKGVCLFILDLQPFRA